MTRSEHRLSGVLIGRRQGGLALRGCCVSTTPERIRCKGFGYLTILPSMIG